MQSSSAFVYKSCMRKIAFPLLIKYLILGVLFVLGLAMTYLHRWEGVFMVVQAIIFTLVPTFLQKWYGVKTPPLLQAGIAVFVFSTVFLGETGHFYEKFWWWDALWHGLSGIVFGLLGYAILILTYRRKNVRLAPLFTSVFAVSFSLAISALWEILEFLVDTITKTTNMQPSGHDTMTDLIIGFAGALISAYSGYRYVRYRERNPLNTIIDDAVKENASAVKAL
jgi:hypothetical protein